jgi:hypothetical protein
VEGSQLELELHSAIADPVLADLDRLWRSLQAALEPLPQEQQLLVAGGAIAQMAEVVYVRADHILAGLERSYLPAEVEAEPCLSREFLEPFIRQSVTLHLESVIVEPPLRQRMSGIQSVVGECSKQSLLEVLAEQEEMLAIAHDENVQDWYDRLRAFFVLHPEPIAFTGLLESVGMDWVEVWMGLLLGEFRLQQRGEFYDGAQIEVVALDLTSFHLRR